MSLFPASSRSLRLALLATALPALACGPEFAVIPQHGLPHETASASGVLITAFSDQWAGSPEDLANTVTPIAVDIYNGTQSEVRVSLEDFSLFNDQGTRLPALNAFENPIASLDVGTRDEAVADGNDFQLQPGVLLAGPLTGPAGSMFRSEAHGGGGGGGGHGGGGGGRGGGGGGGAHFSGGGHFGGGGGIHYGGGGHYGGGHYTIGARARWGAGRRGGWGGGWRGGPRWGVGFHPYHGLGWWYGGGIGYWGGPWAYGPGYDMWVVGWDRYGYAPSPDVVEYALPEGVLAPGAHVNGFLYFERATGTGVHSLTLTWQPHDVHSGQPVGDAKVMLDVVKL